jgi:hypothetical protein
MREVTRKQVRRPGAPGQPEGDPILEALLLQREKAAAAAKQPAAKPTAAAQPVAPVNANPMASLSDRDLKRIAAIQGHARQQAAQAELERRQSSRPEIDASGFGVR